jgi:hypothetical protein
LASQCCATGGFGYRQHDLAAEVSIAASAGHQAVTGRNKLAIELLYCLGRENEQGCGDRFRTGLPMRESWPRRRVRVWFGEYQIADYVGEPAYAARYEAAMRRRFPGLNVTNEALPLRWGEAAERP